MFGLGWLELLVILGVVMLAAGPAGVKKLVGTARSAQRARSQLSPRAALRRLVEEDEPGDRSESSEPRR